MDVPLAAARAMPAIAVPIIDQPIAVVWNVLTAAPIIAAPVTITIIVPADCTARGATFSAQPFRPVRSTFSPAAFCPALGTQGRTAGLSARFSASFATRLTKTLGPAFGAPLRTAVTPPTSPIIVAAPIRSALAPIFTPFTAPFLAPFETVAALANQVDVPITGNSFPAMA